MLLRCLADHQNVIQVHDDALLQKWLEHVIHQLHEGCWGVGEPEWHDRELIVAVACAKGCLGDILISYFDLMVAAA